MKYNKILLLFLLQFILLSSLWAIDVGASGMVLEQEYGPAHAQGLAFLRSANNQYHLGLGLVYLVFFVQLAWLLWVIIGDETTPPGIQRNGTTTH